MQKYGQLVCGTRYRVTENLGLIEESMDQPPLLPLKRTTWCRQRQQNRIFANL